MSRPSSIEWSLIFTCFHIEALCKINGHRSFISRPSTKQWSSIFHIKTLFDGMVIDFHMLSYRGPLQKQWSFFHIEALCKSNGHRSFISRPSAKQWSSIFHIQTLFDGMVIDFHMFSYRGPLQSNGHRSFISRPSSMEWSLIFICFHIEPSAKAMVILSYRGPLQKQWSSIFHIKALCKAMVIDLSYPNPLRWNGH